MEEIAFSTARSIMLPQVYKLLRLEIEAPLPYAREIALGGRYSPTWDNRAALGCICAKENVIRGDNVCYENIPSNILNLHRNIPPAPADHFHIAE